MKTKNGRDLPVTEITADNYKVPQGEELHVHAKIEIRQFDPKTGKRISTPRIQKFGVKEWNGSVQSALRKQGYTVEILHDPTKWQQEKAAEVAEIRAAQAKAAQEAAEAQKAAELAAIKEQAKAEVLAELKAAGIIPDGNAKKEDDKADTQDAKKRAGRPAKDSAEVKED